MRGERPGSIELLRLAPPEWFSESGFLLTSEAGHPETVAREQHVLFVRPSCEPRVLAVSGSVPGSRQTEVVLRTPDRPLGEWTVKGAFQLRAQLQGDDRDTRYQRVEVVAQVPLLLTGVSLAAGHAQTIQPGEGFFLPERDERGRPYRWMAPRARADVHLPRGRARLRIHGRVPSEHYRRPVTLSLTWNGRRLTAFRLEGAEFLLLQDLVSTPGTSHNVIEFDSSHDFMPQQVEGNGDHRRLALRIYGLALEADAPGSASTCRRDASQVQPGAH
jgi:hypothetical protein